MTDPERSPRALWRPLPDRRSFLGVVVGLALVLGAGAAVPQAVRADEGDDVAIPDHDMVVLARLLRDAHSFRVRARAALALGKHGGDATITALEASLGDRHPAVRVAVAGALGRVGTRRSVSALRVAAADRVPDVAAQAKAALREIAARETMAVAASQPIAERPAAPPRAATPLNRVRYVLVVGDMRNRSRGGAELGSMLASRVLEELRNLPYVAVLSLDQMTGSVADEIRRRKLPAFRIDGTIANVEPSIVADEQRMRCEVSLLMMDEPERTLRSVLKGAASASEQLRGERGVQLRALAGKTLKGAVRSALANVEQAVEAAVVRRDLGMPDMSAEASLDAPVRMTARR